MTVESRRRVVRQLLVPLAVVGVLLVAHSEPRHAVAAPVTWDQVDAWIDQYADAYGVSRWWLHSTADCETGYTRNPYAIGRLGEIGPFQWHPTGLWWSTPAGQNGESPWDIERNVEMAAWAFASGLSYHWSCAR